MSPTVVIDQIHNALVATAIAYNTAVPHFTWFGAILNSLAGIGAVGKMAKAGYSARTT
jgi:hypothetical protein